MPLQAVWSSEVSQPGLQPGLPDRHSFVAWRGMRDSDQHSGFCWDLFVPDIQVDELVLGKFFLSRFCQPGGIAKEKDPV